MSTCLGSLQHVRAPYRQTKAHMHGQGSNNCLSAASRHYAWPVALGVSSSAAKTTIWRTCCKCGSKPVSELPERQFSRSIEFLDRSQNGNGFQGLAQRLPAFSSSQEPTAEPQLPLIAESSRLQPGTAEETPHPDSSPEHHLCSLRLCRVPGVPCVRFISCSGS